MKSEDYWDEVNARIRANRENIRIKKRQRRLALARLTSVPAGTSPAAVRPFYEAIGMERARHLSRSGEYARARAEYLQQIEGLAEEYDAPSAPAEGPSHRFAVGVRLIEAKHFRELHAARKARVPPAPTEGYDEANWRQETLLNRQPFQKAQTLKAYMRDLVVSAERKEGQREWRGAYDHDDEIQTAEARTKAEGGEAHDINRTQPGASHPPKGESGMTTIELPRNPIEVFYPDFQRTVAIARHVEETLGDELDLERAHTLPSEQERRLFIQDFRAFARWAADMGMPSLPAKGELVAFYLLDLVGHDVPLGNIERAADAIMFSHDVAEEYLNVVPIRAALRLAHQL